MDREIIEAEFEKSYPVHFLSENAKELVFEFALHISDISRNKARDDAAKIIEQLQREKLIQREAAMKLIGMPHAALTRIEVQVGAMCCSGDQLGQIIKCNGSKRCVFCVAKRQPGSAIKSQN
ncbi:MAG: hypothetical protein M0Q44_01095 [Methylobacter sp.]|nr:hypothetical protein [Methylobacter sp.]